ncbi:glycosyltransferase family 4 protein [Usitatibacter palustris]|uniref:GDP-mannose-dependent alpha-mannosyltransferase n=1 Tax=Usitatibacter palustris TaxID=2732487 RepID=A0A6M4HBF4_9PROT|nr:glycosyltransferase family 1 protein [Usitatibacter palustris]QJR15814.1 GDP-mannose-dependent alpha-mannosyltransferase [Usitatibacter palustris]
MRILLVTDAWAPQINGVVVTLRNTIAWLEKWGHEVRVLSPQGFKTMPMPTYPEIPLALFPGGKVAEVFREFKPDAVHIATEGPLGVAARAYCVKHRLQFTTAYHTCFPEYVQPRFGVPLSWTYTWLKWFHGPSSAIMVGTPAIAKLLEVRNFRNIVEWSRGVDTVLFHPIEERFKEYPRPVFLFVGRVAIEKNIAAFLELDLPGTKVVVGDGPQRKELEKRFPKAVFAGARVGPELASYFQRADVFVFPSLTDTFGLVLLEAMACGTPVAAYPVRGPIDVIKDPAVGVLKKDLREAALAALPLDRGAVRRYAERYSWEHCSRQFLAHLVLARPTPEGNPLERPAANAGTR